MTTLASPMVLVNTKRRLMLHRTDYPHPPHGAAWRQTAGGEVDVAHVRGLRGEGPEAMSAGTTSGSRSAPGNALVWTRIDARRVGSR